MDLRNRPVELWRLFGLCHGLAVALQVVVNVSFD